MTCVYGGGFSLVLKAFGLVIPLMSREWTKRNASNRPLEMPGTCGNQIHSARFRLEILLVHLIASQWGEFLCGPEAQAPPMSAQVVQAMTATIYVHGVEMPELTGADLQRIAMTRANSATGADAISWQCTRHLPLAAWEGLACVFQNVETSAAWPCQLLDVLLVAIPKKMPRVSPRP